VVGAVGDVHYLDVPVRDPAGTAGPGADVGREPRGHQILHHPAVGPTRIRKSGYCSHYSTAEHSISIPSLVYHFENSSNSTPVNGKESVLATVHNIVSVYY
jgi:hypothetical protein